ncbi:MAG: ribonuclease HII [Candidatus Obscuribacterales bacterium]|nr:ribonuclease HII [Candidatus Obscuribacterales bacterium]
MPSITDDTKNKRKRTTKTVDYLTDLLEFDLEIRQNHALSEELVIIGTDEVGRGCLAGPVVAAAIVLPVIERGSPLAVSLSGLNDSKKLTATRREELSSILKDICVFAVAEASVEEIDRLNILNASFLAMRRAISKLRITKESLLLVDGKYKVPQCRHKQIAVVQGDGRSASIAAASVIAKVYRDELMCNLAQKHPEYFWHSNKGYGSSDHRNAIAEYGINQWHRKSFCRSLPEISGKQLSLLAD